MALRGVSCAVGGEWVVRSAGVHRRCVGERKCSARACCCAGARGGLRRGMGGEVGEECIAQSAGVRRGCVGERKCAGAGAGLRRECVVRSAGNASRSLRACVGAAWASGSAREGRVAVRGRAKVFGGEWVVRSARNASSRVGGAEVFGEGAEVLGEGVGAAWGRAEVFGGEWVVRSASLTHIRRSSTRARVLLYIRPPCPRREIAAMGPKDAPASTHRPRRLPHSPRPRLYFRPVVHSSPTKPSAAPHSLWPSAE